MKKTLKILAFVFTGIVVVIVALVLGALPSPKQISKALNGSKKEAAQAQGAPHTESTPETGALPATDSKTTEPVQVTPEEIAEKEKQKAASALVKTFIEEDIKDIRVCENLGRSRYFEKRKAMQPSQDLDFAEIFGDEKRKDSVYETFRYPLKAVFQSSGLSGLLKEIFEYEEMNLAESEKAGFFEKMGFYARATQVAADLYHNKEDYEYLGNRSAHLGVIAKMAALKPELSNDPTFKSHCEELQNSISENESIDIKKERSEIVKLIQESGLSYKELDFNPDSYIKFDMQTSEKGINFSMTDESKPTATK